MAANTSTSASAGGGTSIAGLLGVAFIVLKLTGVIDWSWLWVLAPFWIPVAVMLAVLLIVGVVFLIREAFKSRARRPRPRPAPFVGGRRGAPPHEGSHEQR